MFAGVISRDHGCPWGTSGQTTGVLFHALIDDCEPVGGDPVPHVIDFDGRLYLEDGHHRVVRAALAGRSTIEARVLPINVSPGG